MKVFLYDINEFFCIASHFWVIYREFLQKVIQFTPSFVDPGLFSCQIVVTLRVRKRMLGQLELFIPTCNHSLHRLVVINVYLLSSRGTSLSIFAEDICLVEFVCYRSTSLACTEAIFINHFVFPTVFALVNIINVFIFFLFLFFVFNFSDCLFGRSTFI